VNYVLFSFPPIKTATTSLRHAHAQSGRVPTDIDQEGGYHLSMRGRDVLIDAIFSDICPIVQYDAFKNRLSKTESIVE
jgi:hypothetical protein